LGVRKAENPGKGQDRGAPERPNLVRKAIITSIVAAVLWIGFYFLHQADVFSFRRLVEGS
jgi:predicted secreted protein